MDPNISTIDISKCMSTHEMQEEGERKRCACVIAENNAILLPLLGIFGL